MSVAELLHPENVLQSSAQTSENSTFEKSDSIRKRASPVLIAPRTQPAVPSTPRRTYFDPAREIETSTSNCDEDQIPSATDVESESLASETPPSPSATSESSEPPTTSRYTLVILQQPEAARACGLGERDRRVVDPPPILQLMMDDFDPTSEDDQNQLKLPSNIVHCTLLSVPQGNDVSATVDPLNRDRVIRRLMGTQAANAFIGVDPAIPPTVPREQRPGVFYIFGDVSCRHTGKYRLKFDLMTLAAHTNELGAQANILVSVISDIFEVFNAKDFPGMKSSTSLARELKKQGAIISIKKGNENAPGSRGRRRRGDNDDNTSEG